MTFFCLRSNFRAITRLETLATQATCKVIRVPEAGKFSLVECGILGFGIRNSVQGIRNPTNDWNPEFTAWNPESETVLNSLTWDDMYSETLLEKKSFIMTLLQVSLPSPLSDLKACP